MSGNLFPDYFWITVAVAVCQHEGLKVEKGLFARGLEERKKERKKERVLKDVFHNKRRSSYLSRW